MKMLSSDEIGIEGVLGRFELFVEGDVILAELFGD
jgi:hypothetical protein